MADLLDGADDRMLPMMRAQRSGYIININSVTDLISFPGSGYYAAYKQP